jgi:hypothetical protein
MDAGEPGLEGTPAIGVDLGHRERLGLPAGIEPASEECIAHPPAAQQRQSVHAGRLPKR